MQAAQFETRNVTTSGTIVRIILAADRESTISM